MQKGRKVLPVSGRRGQPPARIPTASSSSSDSDSDVGADSDDEELDEDMAFNSDNKKKYGSFFGGGSDSIGDGLSSDEDKDDDSADSLEDGVDDGGVYMLSLLDKLGPGGEVGTASKATSSQRDLAHRFGSVEEGSGTPVSSNLSMADLLAPLASTRGFGDTFALAAGVSGPVTQAPSSSAAAGYAQCAVQSKATDV